MRRTFATFSLGLVAGALTTQASAQVGSEARPVNSWPPTPATATGAAPQGAYPSSPRPYVLRYDPAAPPPAGYHLEENPRKGLIVAGALTFGVPYLISLTVGGASRNPADRWLLLPVVGPVGTLTYGMRGCDADRGAECAGNVLIIVGLAFDLAAQTAGVILFTMGYVFPKKQWVSDFDVGRRRAAPITWTLLPRVDGAGRVGFTFSGTVF